jgi:hypothetical protein
LATTADFFATDSNIAQSQGKFGSCQTFALLGILGYLEHRDVGAYSPLVTLMQSCKYDHDMRGSGWHGGLGVGKTMALLRAKGLAENHDSLRSMYIQLGKEFEANGQKQEALAKSDAWRQAVQLANERPLIPFPSDVRSKRLFDYSKKDNPVGDPAKSQSIVESLDQCGQVLLLFQNQLAVGGLYPWSKQGLYFWYDPASGVLSRKDRPETKESWNVYSDVCEPGNRECRSGGDHFVILISYARDPASNQVIFVARNSWGPERGQLGNFYLTDSFVNQTARYALAFHKD